ncbi:penicillin-binding transpeptidase domain-containing protein, partial [Salmonella enterica]|uniref:penicillin-binding transpeptidase domain-containing protein n=1 Tax=Salmonella enterica TaxID=28901 RepID=UPI000CC5A386
SIDMQFQEQVEQIARDSLENRIGLNDSVYIVAMDPQNGDLLAITGKRVNEDGEIVDDALGATTRAFTMGSSVKGATVLAGHMDGVLNQDNNVIVDQPIPV